MNVSIVSPIPKSKSENAQPSDFRPISVSSCFASLMEHIILQNIDIRSKTHPNQFGYRNKYSCKHAYFLVNETIKYYNVNKSSVYIASLDAQKAFDKLWRMGLFFKLKDVMPKIFWRALFNYYKASSIVVKYDNIKSNPFKITDGVKQGGILSPYLFNFYVNDLLYSCTELNSGCKIGDFNMSIVAYCDDIILLSSTKAGLQKLLNKCSEFGCKWKLNFNPSKSVVMCLSGSQCSDLSINNLVLGGRNLESVKNMIYLGLPIGDYRFSECYWDEKFSKVQKALYSLNGIGCRAYGLEPLTLSRIYSIYCQPIFYYGLELGHIRKSKLKEYDRSQALLIKRNLGLSKFARNTVLLEALRINYISKLYYKFKILFYYQIKQSQALYQILEYLKKYYALYKCPDGSFVKQLKDSMNVIGVDPDEVNVKESLEALNNVYTERIEHPNKDELFRKIVNLCHLISSDQINSYFYKNILYKILNESTI